MRCLNIVALLLMVVPVTCCGPGPSVTAEPTETRIPPATPPEAATLTLTAVETMTPAQAPSQEPDPEGPLLRMVIIRVRSSLEVRKLRQMPTVDVVMVRPDPDRPPNEELMSSGGFIVEAVVTRDMLATLKAKGFEVVEIPPPEK